MSLVPTNDFDIRPTGTADDYAATCLKMAERIATLEADLAHSREMINDYAAERAPEAMEILAKDRDRWWKLATAAEKRIATLEDALSPEAIFAWLCRKYVQRADARQKSMGLQYTEAETHGLAADFSRFAKAALSRIATLEAERENGSSNG